ncbi:P-loop containing nucleoside triphosphate hydrolase protein [Umbelopsis sp. AD052]|nr:P-loop containing nucleoside triphosphate hydrolase protein [Umbelopsis sp. AD052]
MRRSAAPSKRIASSYAPTTLADQNKRTISNQPENGRSTAGSQYENKRPRVIPQSNDKTAPDSAVQKSTESRYFSIVWRKQSMKKNKTWDGDGYLVLNNKILEIFDTTKKELAKLSTTFVKSYSEGSEFAASGKDFEIAREMTKQEYELETGHTVTESTVSETTDTAAVERPAIRRVALPKFRPHTTLPPAPSVANYSVQPRHKPDVPGSLVLPRPSDRYVLQYNKRNRPLVDVVVDPVICQHLRDHQRQGVAFMYECLMDMKDYGGEGVLLADEMGLGKTLQAIALLWTLLKQTLFHGDPPIIKKALIVCPTSVIENWKKEFKKWLGDERISVYTVDQKSQLNDFLHSPIYSAMIVGYEKLRNMEDELEGASFDIIICDEGHRLKNQNIKTLQVISAMPANKRIILSGTPIQNHLEEFWCMVNFLNPNILGKYSHFKKMYETPINQARQPNSTKEDLELGNERADELLKLASQFMLRREIDVIAKYLKPKVEYVIFCRPSALQQQLYHKLLWSTAWMDMARNRAGFLGCITALKKVSNCPTLVYESAMTGGKQEASLFSSTDCLDEFPENFDGRQINHKDSGKLYILVELLAKLRQHTSEKVVLVSNYTQTLDILEVMCDEHNYKYYRLDGSTPAAQRQTMVDHFNEPDDDRFVFLLSAKSGGIGLNLTGASRLILFDPDCNPSVDKQVMARIYRDGQKRTAHVYRLLTTGTIDEKIFQRQLNKSALSESIMGLGEEPSVNHFSDSQIRDLFRLDTDTFCQTHDLLQCKCSETAKNMESEEPRQAFVTKNDIKSLQEWKHIVISENTVDNDILAIDDTILTQALLTFRQRQEDIVSFVMKKSNQ